jgi:hypothetical protein
MREQNLMSSIIPGCYEDKWIPKAIDGLQVNFCKNPTCLNYGRPASSELQPRGRGATSHADRDAYSIVGSSNYTATMTCKLCGEHPPIKSNLAITEELTRMSNYVITPSEASCPNIDCINNPFNSKHIL